MNRITRIVIGIALALSSACNYLDVVPEDNATLDDAFKSQDKALSYLFSIYGHLPNNIQYWMPGQPCGGDDLAVAVKGTTRWFCYKSMVYGEESASTVYHNFMRHSGAPTGGVNYDYYSAIRYAYTFLDRIQQVPDISETNLREWQGEAWYLIGYFHWALLEYYGPIVIMDHEISLNADETELYKPRNTFDECVDFIVECFDKAIEMLPAAPAEHPLVRPRIGSRSPRIQGPHAALRRQPALQRQQRVLLPPAQLRRHLPGQPDIRSRQMGAGPHRGGAGHKLRRAERLPALRESGQRVDRRQLRTGCPKLPRLLRRTGIQHRRISVRLRPHRRSQEDPAALRHPHRTPLLGR